MPIRGRFDAAIFVTNLPYDSRPEDLKTHFEENCKKVLVKEGSATVFFDDISHAIAACTKFNGTLFNERRMFVKLHKFSSFVSIPKHVKMKGRKLISKPSDHRDA